MSKTRLGVGLLLTCLAFPLFAVETNWPQFRGPSGNGIAASSNLPTAWAEDRNVTWKTPVHGRAWSSPVIWGSEIWLTTATEDARQLFVLCLNKATGEVIRDEKVFNVEKPQYVHPFNSAASPTPVIEDGRLYFSFGAPGTGCMDTKTGKILWARRDLECNHFRGAGSSPIIYKDLLFLNFDGSDHQFLVALNKNTGETVWRKDRSIDFQDLGPDGKPQLEGDLRKAFATCHVAALDGVDTLLSPGSKAFYAYEPLTGAELWRVEERTSYSASTRPVVGDGLIFAPSGFASGQLLAIRPGKKGEIADAKETDVPGRQLQVTWRVKKNVPKKPSLLLMDGLLYGLDDVGFLTAWEPATGEVVWTQKIGGRYSASLLGAGKHIYAFDEEGKALVIEAGRTFKKIAENLLESGFMASPAVSADALFLRTEKHVYRIENRG